MKTTYKIQVHYLVGKSVNIDYFTCSKFESDIGAGVIRLTDGQDYEGPVKIAQYSAPYRVLIRPETT